MRKTEVIHFAESLGGGVPDHPPRHHDHAAIPREQREARRTDGPSCAYPSASKTKKTSPTWIRRMQF